MDREVRESLAGHAEREIAARSVSGALVYFVVSVVLAFSTPYYSQHPVIIAVVACATFLLGGTRMVAAWRLRTQAARLAGTAGKAMVASIYGTFVVWGLFCAWTLRLYAGGWTAMLLLLCTASLAGGTTSSLAPDLPLAWRCLTFLVGPTVVAAGTLGDTRHWALAGLAFLYLCFLLTQARDNWRAFWTASVAAEREKIRGSAERLRAERERASLAVAIEQTAEAILITDLDGNIRYCNPAFERISGYSCEEAVGRNPRFLKSGQQSAEFYQDLWTTITSGRVWSGHIINRRKDGSLCEQDATISPIRDKSGNLTGFVAASRDVTERVSLENQLKQAQKLESIGRLAGGVAHDFNNLLTVINGYSEMTLSRLPEGDPLRELLLQIRKAGERAADLTRQLLAFSRKQLIEPRRVDLNELILESAGMLRRIVREDIEIATSLSPAAGHVMADPGQLHQVLINLVLNARDAMPSGGRLTLRSSRVELDPADAAAFPDIRPGPYAVMEVADTGVGMSDDIQQKVFDPFFTTKPEGKGTGLGLSTVYGIVRQGGGWIRIESCPGMGATFRIGLPALAAATPERPDAAPPQTDLPGAETILVVEDQDEVRHFVIAMLQKFRYRTLEASCGEEAVTIVENYEGAIHLILTDVIMPGMTGRQAADRLRLARPEMKVIFMSGYSDDVISREGLLDPGIDYLAKPFTAEAMAQKIRIVLDRKPFSPGGHR
ncbi:MAG: PAS domain S-box protein [Acidobacteria bacterium]|nr:PAS domain S-box protein [Acidobacteriota bacterium]